MNACAPLPANLSTSLRRLLAVPLVAAALLSTRPEGLAGQWEGWRDRDRGGPGVPSSMFGTFVEAGDLLVYPFYEYYRDADAEYKPSELGYAGDVDYFGEYEAHEGLVLVAYGISDRLHVEFEAAVISARQDKADDDVSDFPARLEQSGLGDVEAQLRYQFRPETAARAGIFGYFETVFPSQKQKLLIGTADWEFQYGMGLIRSRSWGTTAVRLAVGYAEGSPEFGEYAVEYVRGLSESLRAYAAIEGSEDEVELITELQVLLGGRVKLKLNSAFGMTRKAPGWAPEVGVVFRF